jgi:hypothetical protein
VSGGAFDALLEERIAAAVDAAAARLARPEFVNQRTIEAVLSVPRADFLAHCRARDWPSFADRRLRYARTDDVMPVFELICAMQMRFGTGDWSAIAPDRWTKDGIAVAQTIVDEGSDKVHVVPTGFGWIPAHVIALTVRGCLVRPDRAVAMWSDALASINSRINGDRHEAQSATPDRHEPAARSQRAVSPDSRISSRRGKGRRRSAAISAARRTRGVGSRSSRGGTGLPRLSAASGEASDKERQVER